MEDIFKDLIAVKCTAPHGKIRNSNEGGHGSYYINDLFIMRREDYLNPMGGTVDAYHLDTCSSFVVYLDEISVVDNDIDLNIVKQFISSRSFPIRISNTSMNYN